MLINKPRKSFSFQITDKLLNNINSALTPDASGINQPNTSSSNINDK